MADKKTLEYQIKVLADQAVASLSDMSAKLKGMAEKVSDASEKIKKNSATFTDLESAAKQAASSIKLFGASSSELRAMQQKLKDGTLSLIAQGFKPEQSEIKKLVEEYKNLGKQADDIDSKNNGLMGMFQKLKSEVGNLAVTVAAVKFDKFLAKAASYALESADSINTVRNNFGIMLNDMEAGYALADRINAFNVNTPFNLTELSTATQVLRTAKVGLKDIEEYLTRFGDLALGDSQKFASFTNAFAKASAKGKADMEVLNIYLERGIPILDTLAKNMGKTSAEITDMASKGKISFTDLNDAIKTLTDEGGGYFGTMNLAADSWASTLAGAREATNSLVASLGNMLMPVLKSMVNAYTATTNAINSSPLLKGILVGAITTLATIINTKMVISLISLAAKTWAVFAAQMSLNSALSVTNPLLLAGIAAVGTATAGFVAYASAQQKAHSESSELALSLCQQKDAMVNLKAEAEEFMKFMNGASLDKAQKTVKDYESSVLSAKEKLESSLASLAELKEKLSATPKTLTVELKGRRFAGRNWNKPNPEYADLEKQVEHAQQIVDGDQTLYDTLSARLEVARKNTGELRQKILDFTTEWSQKLADNNSSAVERITAQQSKAMKKLEKDAQEAFGKNYLDKTTAEYRTYQRELTALRAYYARERQKQIDKEAEDARKKIEDALKTVTSWLDKGGTSPYQKLQEQINAVSGETTRSIEKLKKAAETAFGKEYETDAQYVKALSSLKEYYLNKEHDLRMQQVEEYNSRFQKIISELNLKTVEAINAGNTKEAASNSAKSAAMNSASGKEAGKLIAGFASGGPLGALAAAIGELVTGIINAVAALENGNKVLNPFTTIIGKIMDVIGEVLNETLEPIADVLETVGTVLGKLLKPLVQIWDIMIHFLPQIQLLLVTANAIGNILQGIYEALTPIFNGFIRLYNDYLLKIFAFFGGSTKKMKEIGESTEEAAKEAEKHAEFLKKQYQRQMNTINDLLNSQISSLKTQYELGLISRDDYNKKAEEYSALAEDKLYEIEQEMNSKLGDIAENTGDITIEVKTLGNYFSDFGNWIKDSKIVDFFNDFWNNLVAGIKNAISGVGDGVKDKAESFADKAKEVLSNAGSTIKSGVNKVKDWFGFDVGTPEIPYDMPAVVHKGETIVPRTFAEGIRRGDLALVGGKSGGTGSGNIINVQLNVHGSVVTQQEITDAVYNGIALGIRSGKKAPLPMSA